MSDNEKTYSERFKGYKDEYFTENRKILPISKFFLPEIYKTFNEAQDSLNVSGAKLLIEDSPIANACYNLQHFEITASKVIVVTTKLLDMLDKKELKSLFGHELHHAFNQDKPFDDFYKNQKVSKELSMTSLVSTTIAITGFLLQSQDSIVGQAGLVFSIASVAAAQLFSHKANKTSYKIEYGADEAGANILEAKYMASGLEKLQKENSRIKQKLKKENPKFRISKPKDHRHPPIKKRIERLKKMQVEADKQTSR